MHELDSWSKPAELLCSPWAVPREPLPHAKQVCLEGQAALFVGCTVTAGTCLALRIFLVQLCIEH